MYHVVTSCRACGYGSNRGPGGVKAAEQTEKLIPVLDLGVQPLANDFRKDNEERAGYAPLKVLYCPRCTLAQLSVVVRPEILYRDYAYVTSPSETMKRHFASLTNDVLTEIKPGSVIEVGSNDGLFLAYLHERGFGNLVGIDPAKNLAEKASKIGIMTINDFIGLESAKQARDACGKPDLIMARHVFCHVHDWRGFMAAMDQMAEKDTLICIEAPYVMDQLAAGSFDQVYHEHLSYLSLQAVKALLQDTPFHLHRITHYDIHGGVILMMIRRNDSGIPPHPSVADFLNREDASIGVWERFAAESELQIIRLRDTVRDLVAQGKKVCGYGASAKSTVWINACGFTRKDLAFVCDSTAYKVYSTTPGTDIPIVHEGEHFTQCADYVVLFAWNYAKEIMDRETQFNHGGFKWIVPVPKLEII